MSDEGNSPDQRESERRNVVDRRLGLGNWEGPERRSKLDRRRGPGRRRCDLRREAEEGEMSGELLEFVMAIDDYKRVNNRMFPTWSEVFEVICYLGYRKVAGRGEHVDRPEEDNPPIPS